MSSLIAKVKGFFTTPKPSKLVSNALRRRSKRARDAVSKILLDKTRSKKTMTAAGRALTSWRSKNGET